MAHLHWFARIVLLLALAGTFFIAFRLGVTFAGLFVLLLIALWLINRTGDDEAPPPAPPGPFG